MSILYILIPLSLVLVVFGIWAFFWAVGNGQFDDLETPAWEVLIEEPVAGTAPNARQDDRLAATPQRGEGQEEASSGETGAQG